MVRYVFDTNIFRYARRNEAFRTRVETYSPYAYSSVVLSELRRSTVDAEARRTLEIVETRAARSAALVTPTHQDWLDAGEFLATKAPASGRANAQLQNYLRRLQFDALIAFSCWSRGFAVVTCNRLDFLELRDFWKPGAGNLVVELPPRSSPAG